MSATWKAAAAAAVIGLLAGILLAVAAQSRESQAPVPAFHTVECRNPHDPSVRVPMLAGPGLGDPCHAYSP